MGQWQRQDVDQGLLAAIGAKDDDAQQRFLDVVGLGQQLEPGADIGPAIGHGQLKDVGGLEQAIQVVVQVEGAAAFDLNRLIYAETVKQGLAEKRYLCVVVAHQPAIDDDMFGYGSE